MLSSDDSTFVGVYVTLFVGSFLLCGCCSNRFVALCSGRVKQRAMDELKVGGHPVCV